MTSVFNAPKLGQDLPRQRLSVEQIDEMLGVGDAISRLHSGVEVLHYGADAHIGVNALIHTMRPDISVHSVPLDQRATFRVDEALDPEDEAYIEAITGKKRRYPTSETAVTRTLPLHANTYSFSFSTVIPEAICQQDGNVDAVLRGIARASRWGASINLGPHSAGPESEWGDTVSGLVESGADIDSKILPELIIMPKTGYTADAYTTRLIR